jgi:hypothetical protein
MSKPQVEDAWARVENLTISNSNLGNFDAVSPLSCAFLPVV